jgi:hypothetical protein
MFSREQIIGVVKSYLPYAPGYVHGRFGDVVHGFIGGLAVCAALFGQGSWLGLWCFVAIWLAVGAMSARLADVAIQSVIGAAVKPVLAHHAPIDGSPNEIEEHLD